VKASELQRDSLGILIIGDPGTGKTRFISTMPKPALIFNFDGKAGASTYARSPGADDIELIMFPTGDEEGVSVLDLEDKIDELAKLSTDKFPYKTVALDSLTSYGDAEMRRAIYVNSIDKKGGSRLGNIVPNQTDYLLQMAKVKLILQKLLALPCNVAVAAHEAIIEDKNGGYIGVVAHVSGKKTLAKSLPSMFGEAYHSEQIIDRNEGTTSWRIRCRGNEELQWCFSKIGLPDLIEPSFEVIERFLRGGL